MTRQKNILEDFDQAIVLTDADLRIEYVNERYLEMWKVSREFLRQRPTISEVISEICNLGLYSSEDREELIAHRMSMFESGCESFDLEIPRADGFSINGHVRKLHGGGYLLTFIDVTENARQRAALDKTREHLQLLFEKLPHGILECNDVGRIIYVNKQICSLWETQEENLLGRLFVELDFPETIRQLHRGRFQQAALEIMSPFIEVVPWQNKQSQPVWMQIDWRPCYANDQLTGFIGVVTDISIQIDYEETIRTSESKYRQLSSEFETIFNGIPDSLTVWAEDLRLLWANRQTCDYYRRSLEELTGLACEEVCIYDACLEDDCEIRRSLITGQMDERMRKSRDGRTWGIKTFPLRDTSNGLFRVIRLASDLSERIRLREEATRTIHLAALGELAAGVAHEINNPIGLIILNLSLIRDTLRDTRPLLEERYRQEGDFVFAGLKYSYLREHLPELLNEVGDSARRIKQIVGELKDFSRPTDPYQFESVDLNQVVVKAARLIAGQMKKLTDHFIVHKADDLPPVRGNIHRLEQVIINLLLNAGQALPDRSRSVEISIVHHPESRCNAIVVQDQGVGIRDEHLQMITDPFFTTRRELGGTGLGLSVSSRIVQEHGGTLHFKSKLGSGTTVTIELPMTDEEAL